MVFSMPVVCDENGWLDMINNGPYFLKTMTASEDDRASSRWIKEYYLMRPSWKDGYRLEALPEMVFPSGGEAGIMSTDGWTGMERSIFKTATVQG